MFNLHVIADDSDNSSLSIQDQNSLLSSDQSSSPSEKISSSNASDEELFSSDHESISNTSKLQDTSHTYSVRVLAVGDSACGKTSALNAVALGSNCDTTSDVEATTTGNV